MANAGSIGVLTHVEDWHADNIGTASGDGLAWVQSSDGGTAFARAVAAGYGRHCQGVMAATDDHMHELCTDLLGVYGQDGFNAIEVLFKISVATDIAFNIGFNDIALEAVDATLPVELSGTTWTSTSSTFVGLVFDVDATNDEVHCFWVNADSDTSTAIADLRMKGASLAASQWAAARVEIQDRGTGNGVRATFNWTQNGKSFEKTFDTSVARGTALCPYIAFENRAGTAHTIYVKYIKLQQGIAD